MSSFRVYKVIITIILSVVFFLDFNCLAGKIQARQSLSQNARKIKRKKDPGSPLSEIKHHFESKVIVMSAIQDYEVEFTASEKNQTTNKSRRESIARAIQSKDVPENATLDSEKCRKEIRERKQRWTFNLENPPSEKVARLKSRVENKDNQFTVEEFCHAIAILYQRIKDDNLVEVKKLRKSVHNPISKYDRTKFVIPFLLEEYPGEISKAVRELIEKELKC